MWLYKALSHPFSYLIQQPYVIGTSKGEPIDVSEYFLSRKLNIFFQEKKIILIIAAVYTILATTRESYMQKSLLFLTIL